MTITPPSSEEYLKSFINYEAHLHQAHASAFTLVRIQKLLDLLGRPDHSLKIIHVAGSKGKGSVCAMTAQVLKEAGYTVGLYTSPHLDHWRERIRVLDPRATPPCRGEDVFPDQIPEKALAGVLVRIKPAVDRAQKEEGPLSFFEVMTATALVYFAQQKVDFAVLEVGVGGRLDATNAARSWIAAVTLIDFDHTRLLGKTLPAIAVEKAQIIKPGCRQAIVAMPPEELREIFIDQGKAAGVPGRFTLPDKGHELSLKGPHQQENAGVVLGILQAVREGGFLVGTEAVRKGLANTVWPGRFETMDLSAGPAVIIDGAHSAGSAGALARTWNKEFPGQKATLILGVSEDKDRKSICRALAGIADCVIAVKAGHPRAHHFQEQEVRSLFPGKEVHVIPDPAKALAFARETTAETGRILATGSLFLVSEIRKLCISTKG